MKAVAVAFSVAALAPSLHGCGGGGGPTPSPTPSPPTPAPTPPYTGPPTPVPTEMPTAVPTAPSSDISNFRVAKAHSKRGYNKVRISVVTNGKGTFEDFFDYNAPFAHRWTDYHLHSTIKDVADGGSTFTIGKEQVTVKIPKEGAKTRAVLLADPCFSSRDLHCALGERFNVFDRLVKMTDTLVGSDDIDFWGILGDNFYENRFPSLSAQFFDALSMAAKTTPIVAVPGNHDYWITGGPTGQTVDQFGYGFMQMYGQDTEASFMNGSAPYDYSVTPAPGQPDTLPIQENFVFSHQIGDVAVLGWTGASTWTDFEPYAQKYCSWLDNAPTVNTALLLGHWNKDDLGCYHGLSAPDVYAKLKDMAGCNKKLMLYVDGHLHCNQVTEPGHGFMIGANGMSGCTQFGFLVLESDPNANGGPNVRVDYIELANDGADYFDAVHGCFAGSGSYESCRDTHAKSWRSHSFQDDVNVNV